MCVCIDDKYLYDCRGVFADSQHGPPYREGLCHRAPCLSD